MGRGNESLFMVSWSHDQDGHHIHIIYGKKKTPKIFFSRPDGPISTKVGM